jgi:hypothetical protein
MPQAPQLFGSSDTLMHALPPPQRSVAGGHNGTQVPFAQRESGLQTLPHAPQFC